MVSFTVLENTEERTSCIILFTHQFTHSTNICLSFMEEKYRTNEFIIFTKKCSLGTCWFCGIYEINRLLWWLTGKESTCNAGDVGDAAWIPESGKFSGKWKGKPFRCSCLDSGACLSMGSQRAGQWAQNGVTYTRPLVSKLRFNSFSSLRHRNLNQSIRNHLISTW